MVPRLSAAISLAFLATACGAQKTFELRDYRDAQVSGQPDAAQQLAPDASVAPDATTPPAEGYLTRLENAGQFGILADFTPDAGNPGEVKYLAPVGGKPRQAPLLADCYFQDMHLYAWHIFFLQSFPELRTMSLDAYTSLVLKHASRTLWGGGLKTWPAVRHPLTNQVGIVAYSIYSETTTVDLLTEQDILEVDARLKSCMPYATSLLVYVPDDPFQENALHTLQPKLAVEGVASGFSKVLMAGIPPASYSQGEGYGLLKVLPRGQVLLDHGPRDVVVVEMAPGKQHKSSGALSPAIAWGGESGRRTVRGGGT